MHAHVHTHTWWLFIGRQLIWYGIPRDGDGSRETKQHLPFRQEGSFLVWNLSMTIAPMLQGSFWGANVSMYVQCFTECRAHREFLKMLICHVTVKVLPDQLLKVESSPCFVCQGDVWGNLREVCNWHCWSRTSTVICSPSSRCRPQVTAYAKACMGCPGYCPGGHQRVKLNSHEAWIIIL